MAFKLGDAVKVKQGVKDVETREWDMSGWQGWIIEPKKKNDPSYELIWDTETFKNMPNGYIQEANMEGLDWLHYALTDDELESAKPRDTFKAAKAFAEKWEIKHTFNDGSEEGNLIMEMCGDETNMYKVLDKWKKYLSEKLIFPFDATVTESDNKVIKEGQKISVLGMDGSKKANLDNGFIVTIKVNGQEMPHPLCDLEIQEEDSPNALPVNAYGDWLVNNPM